MFGWISCIQVATCVMGATSDQASSMTKALETFEGAPCVDHKIQNAMKHASRGAFITQLEKSCRGLVAHFRRSSKVNIISFTHYSYVYNDI